ncbi:MAG: (2Fe-2S)-binding protein [Alphaproteobacteria bacterium]|nr:(2Fe-2S)-binding protein [Alphaproteobacteria bacterium]MBT4083946.1 (2Fe-2S)-binding protein [Alphaproteobacteria bacterium]MBT4543541.1 (2Fe-2S)-binding protein [Alphaproteobacteria bacterium]MBT7747453.1 (2Fe-2S)-binding protein [Alphaproteobacteria bacterium]
MYKLNVNGTSYEIDITASESLSDVLRDRLGLLGVKVSCGEGECGSCTVLVDGKPETSCLKLGRQAEGQEITTIEGMGTYDDLHPIQEAYIEEQGFQCGFCTPGFIMATKAFLDSNPNPTEEEASEAMSGNICRCGAHPYIVKSVLKAAEKIRG